MDTMQYALYNFDGYGCAIYGDDELLFDGYPLEVVEFLVERLGGEVTYVEHYIDGDFDSKAELEAEIERQKRIEENREPIAALESAIDNFKRLGLDITALQEQLRELK